MRSKVHNGIAAPAPAIRAPTLAVGDNDELQSSREDFEEFCRVMEGRWIGDVIWITDWPGFGKKGDKVIAYQEWRVVEGGKGLLGRFYGGPGSGSTLVRYDVRTRQIRDRSVSSGGSVWNHLIYKKDGKWHYKTSGSTGEGKKITGSSIRHISDDGKTHRWLGTWEIDGNKLDPLRHVFRRIGDWLTGCDHDSNARKSLVADVTAVLFLRASVLR